MIERKEETKDVEWYEKKKKKNVDKRMTRIEEKKKKMK